MRVELAKKEDLNELKMLWSIVFQEDPAFLEKFFSLRFQPEYIVVARKDGEIVSALHALPSTYVQGGEEKPCAFIVGAATYAAHRRQGIMGKLLSFTQETLPYPITLFPAVRPFYEANGYITTSAMHEYWLPGDKIHNMAISENHNPATLDSIYREATKEEGALMRDERGWEFLTDGYELCSAKGSYAFIKDGIAIEAMAIDKESAQALVRQLQAKGIQKIRVIPASPFEAILEGPCIQIPMGMSTDLTMNGVYIAEQY